jgi:hypothetical protein
MSEALYSSRPERLPAVHQAERHNKELEEALVGAEGHLLHVIGMHPHLVIVEAKVELHEKLGAAQLIELSNSSTTDMENLSFTV